METTYDYESIDDIDSEDFYFALLDIEKRFGITFLEDELSHISTFGEFYDCVTRKISPTSADDCTTQQAFYKLREVCAATLQIDKRNISPATRVGEFIPAHQRRAVAGELRRRFGLPVLELSRPKWLKNLLRLGIIASSIAVFVAMWAGFLGYFLVILAYRATISLKKELAYPAYTMGNAARYFAYQHYASARRNPKTCNKKEVETIIFQELQSRLSVSAAALARESPFRK